MNNKIDFSELNKRFKKKQEKDKLTQILKNTKVENQQLENAILAKTELLEQTAVKISHTEFQLKLIECLDSMPSCLEEIPGGYTKIIEPLENLAKQAFVNEESIFLGENDNTLQIQINKLLNFIDKNYLQLGRTKKVAEINDLDKKYQILMNKKTWAAILTKVGKTGKKIGFDVVLE